MQIKLFYTMPRAPGSLGKSPDKFRGMAVFSRRAVQYHDSFHADFLMEAQAA